MKNKTLSKILIVALSAIFLIAVIVAAGFYSSFSLGIKTSSLLENLSQDANFKTDKIEHFLSMIESNILFLSELSSLNSFINSQDGNLRVKSDLQNDFLQFSNFHKVYHQIRYIDENGQEIIRIDSDGESSWIAPKDKLQNKKERYYFIEAMKLNKNEVFISPLDLNVENEKLENRGAEDDPVYVPVIRYSTPLFDNFGKSKGVVVTNIYADFFLHEIQGSQIVGAETFLINAKGFYLSHPDKAKEFEFMFGKESSFFNDYPDITKDILANDGRIFLDKKDYTVSFKYVYPAFGKVNFQKTPKENHFWVLVIIYKK